VNALSSFPVCWALSAFHMPFNVSSAEAQLFGNDQRLRIPLLNVKRQIDEDRAVGLEDLKALQAADQLPINLL